MVTIPFDVAPCPLCEGDCEESETVLLAEGGGLYLAHRRCLVHRQMERDGHASPRRGSRRLEAA